MEAGGSRALLPVVTPGAHSGLVLPAVAAVEVLAVEAHGLVDALRGVMHVAAVNAVSSERLPLVQVRFGGGRVRCAATDGHRVVVAENPSAADDTDVSLLLVLPTSAAKLLLDFMGSPPPGEPLLVYETEIARWYAFRRGREDDGRLFLVGHPPEGFPASVVGRALESPRPAVAVEVEATLLRAAWARMRSFCEDRRSGVELRLAPGDDGGEGVVLTASVGSAAAGTLEERLECCGGNGAAGQQQLTLHCNVSYLGEAFASMQQYGRLRVWMGERHLLITPGEGLESEFVRLEAIALQHR